MNPIEKLYTLIYTLVYGFHKEAAMECLSITFPEDLKEALDRQAKREHTKRSTLIQKAVRIYLQIKKQKEINHLLREGYREMADEALQLLREFKTTDRESLKYVD